MSDGSTVIDCMREGRALDFSSPNASSLTLVDLTIRFGYSTSNGGAVFATAPVIVRNSFFQSCTALLNGGAIFMELGTSASIDISDSGFSSSTAGKSGAGVYLNYAKNSSNANINVKNCSFTGAKVSGDLLAQGGGISITFSGWAMDISVSISGCVFADNELSVGVGGQCEGAGINIQFDDLATNITTLFEGDRFSGNQLASTAGPTGLAYGSGLHLVYVGDCFSVASKFQDCVFSRNSVVSTLVSGFIQ
jgi:hypothetical protein